MQLVQRWNKPSQQVERGMGERFSRAEQLEHRVQMLLGVISAKVGCRWNSNRRTLWVSRSPNIWMSSSRKRNGMEASSRC
jgi:hypothetical protein